MSSGATRRLAALWLVIWTLNNVGVTLLNKAAFSMVDFPYPYTLTAIHMAVCAACCHAIFCSIRNSSNAAAAAATSNSKNINNKATTPSSSNKNVWVRLLGDQLQQPLPTLDARGRRLIGLFSVIFSLNIAFGNVSLKYVSVNFNQVLRSLVPVVTLWCSLYGLRSKQPISRQRQRAVWPVVAGVALAGAGDRYAVTAVGVVATLLSVVLASLKVVASSELLTGGTAALKLHPVVLLQLLAPLALVQCLILALATGELGELGRRWNADFNPWTTGDCVPGAVLLFSGLLAFALNISALQAYKLTSPLTCCIAAAVKQVLMIVISTILFRTPVSLMNGTGIVVVLVASAYYSIISVQEQAQQNKEKKNVDVYDKSSLHASSVRPAVDIECSVMANEEDDTECESTALLVVEEVRERQEDAVRIITLQQQEDDEPSRKMGRWFRNRNESAV